MENELEISRPKSFEGFDWKKFMAGFKKPAIMLLTVGIGILAAKPELNTTIVALGGVGVIAERIWAVVEFYLKEVEL